MPPDNDGPKLAVLLAAGRGKRLRPWTDSTPKPLLPVEGRPTLDFTLAALQRVKITHVIFIVGHLGEQIVRYVGDGAAWGIKPYFCEQKELLGTAHALKQAVDTFPKLFEENRSFILTATDYLFVETALLELAERKQQTESDIIISLKMVPPHELSSRSSVRYSGDFEIQEIVEKPAEGEAPSSFSGSLTFILPTSLIGLLSSMEPSERGEYEIQSLINKLISTGVRASGVLQPTPAEWQKPDWAQD